MGKKTTTTTAPPNFNQVLAGIKQLGQTSPLGGILGGAANTQMPGVPTTQGADVVTWQSSGQNPSLSLTPAMQKLLTTDSSGNQQISYNSAVQLLHLAANDRSLLVEIQNDLKTAGFITASQKVAFGTLDKTTLNAWKQAVTDAIGTNTPITKLLTTNSAATQYIPETTALQSKYQTALDAAASVQAPMLTLTDPNKVAQSYATAMESMGEGAPSKEQVAKFVTAFHNAEVSAVQDAYTAQKSDYMQGANTDLTQLKTLEGGPPTAPTPAPMPVDAAGQQTLRPPEPVNPGALDLYNRQLAQYDNTMNQQGPVTVAQKAMPNLDAEAIAAAQSSNPGQYYATGSTYLYGLLQRMLSGDMTLPTSPTSPTTLTPGGGIVTSPIAGAP